MLAQLIPLDGGSPITLKQDVTLVGRKRGLCDLIVDRGSVSKLHCLVVKTDGLLCIRDLGSTNGTKVNGQRVTRGALLPGDELSFASVSFRVHLGPGSVEATHDDPTEMINLLSDRDDDSLGEPLVEDMGSESDVRLLPEDQARRAPLTVRGWQVHPAAVCPTSHTGGKTVVLPRPVVTMRPAGEFPPS